MPSALRASRDFLAEGVARVRSGISRYAEDLEKPGQEIKVEPFDAMNASTAAGLVKLGTSIAAARRRKANLDEAQQDLDMEREKNRAQIAEIRAREKYYLGEGRQSGSDGPAVLDRQVGIYPPGTPIATVNAGHAQERIEDARKATAARNRRAGRLSGAREGLKQIDAQAARDIAARSATDLGTWKWTFENAAKGNPLALERLGIDPKKFNLASNEYGSASVAQKQQMIEAARQRIAAGITRRNSLAVHQYFQPQREKLQSIIDQSAEGFDDEDATDPLGDDPLGLFSQ